MRIRNNYQQGATLIIVMVVLLVIVSMGVISVRQSRSDLIIANSVTTQDMLIQASDMAMAKIEQDVRENSNFRMNTLTGYVERTFNKDSGTPNAEIVFCLRPLSNKLFNPAKVGKIIGQNKSLRSGGACKVDTLEDYTSKRGTVMAQVTVTNNQVVAVGEPLPFSNCEPGSTSCDILPVTIHSTALLPALSTASDEDINDCLGNRLTNDYSDTAIDSISDCLESLGVPYHTQVQNYEIKTG